MRLTVIISVTSFLLGHVGAQSALGNLNPTGEGCVDPAGYLSCYRQQEEQFTACSRTANATCSDTTAHLQTCLLGCNGHYLASKIGCWLQSCWNRVYSCEYQKTAAEYIVGVNLVQSSVRIPFYPPPDGDLPGGCSCNVGNAVGNFTDNPKYHCLPAAETGDRTILAECHCCQSAIVISNALNACPKNDLSFIGFNTRLQSVQNTLFPDTPNQCAVLDAGLDSAGYCARTYDVTELVGPVIYNPLKLPAGVPGTEPMSNFPGTAITAAASAITLALDPGYSSVIVPVSHKRENTEKSTTSSNGSRLTSSTTTDVLKTTTESKTGTTPSKSLTGSAMELKANIKIAVMAICLGIFGIIH